MGETTQPMKEREKSRMIKDRETMKEREKFLNY